MPSLPISAVAQYALGGAKDGPATLKVIHLTIGTASGLQVTVKGRRAGSALTPIAIPYRKRYLNAAVADDTYVTSTITDTSLIEVNSAGIDVILDCTAISSGIAQVDYCNVTG